MLKINFKKIKKIILNKNILKNNTSKKTPYHQSNFIIVFHTIFTLFVWWKDNLQHIYPLKELKMCFGTKQALLIFGNLNLLLEAHANTILKS
jgi:hypothetical protein